jgi:polyhydroxybutyrate depolymerase
VAARNAGTDDVAYLRGLIAHLAEERGADPQRVYVLGYSGGGHMAFRLALEAPSLVRGVAVFGANLPTDEESLCRPRAGGVPTMIVNGLEDPVNPWQGGDVIAPSGVALGTVRSAVATARYLRVRAGPSVEVRLVPMKGGGHVVPGPHSRFPAAAGRTIGDFAGVAEALAFFSSLESPRPRAAGRSTGPREP